MAWAVAQPSLCSQTTPPHLHPQPPPAGVPASRPHQPRQHGDCYDMRGPHHAKGSCCAAAWPFPCFHSSLCCRSIDAVIPQGPPPLSGTAAGTAAGEELVPPPFPTHHHPSRLPAPQPPASCQLMPLNIYTPHASTVAGEASALA
jgi:hypothetical protein